MRFKILLIFLVTFASLYAGEKLEEIKRRGYIRCGVSTGFTGFSSINENGKWEGFDVDYCRAIAAAIFTDAGKVEFVPLSNKDRFLSLSRGHIDVLSRVTSWNFKRDISLGVVFSAVSFYDAQAIMVSESSKIERLEDLNNQSVCLITGSTTERNLFETMDKLGLEFEPVIFTTASAMMRAFQLNRCDAITSDKTSLEVIKQEISSSEQPYKILDEYIAKEPLGIAVAKDDIDWLLLTRWVMNILILAEEKGISQDNIDQLVAQRQLLNSVKYFLDGGSEQELLVLGLKTGWVADVIRSVGNYDDIFQRNFEALSITRGLNRLWDDGGLLYAPPFE